MLSTGIQSGFRPASLRGRGVLLKGAYRYGRGTLRIQKPLDQIHLLVREYVNSFRFQSKNPFKQLEWQGKGVFAKRHSTDIFVISTSRFHSLSAFYLLRVLPELILAKVDGYVPLAIYGLSVISLLVVLLKQMLKPCPLGYTNNQCEHIFLKCIYLERRPGFFFPQSTFYLTKNKCKIKFPMLANAFRACYHRKTVFPPQ